MIAIKLRELIASVDGAVVRGDDSLDISTVEYDSRLIRPGGLFVAVKGYRQDGYSFAAAACQNGAVAILGERESCDVDATHIQVPDSRKALADVAAAFYDYPGNKLKVCGVTGTNGKTTTCFLIKNILEARNKTTGLVTSLVYDTGRERFSADRTTPESLDLQRLLLLMRKNYCVNAVVEVSSHALELHRVDHINFRVAVYTNITRDHLDFHGTMDAYLAAKAKLLTRLSGPLSYAVINLDVPEFRQLFGTFESSFMSYSLESDEADVFCEGYELLPDRTLFDLVTPMGTHTVSFPLPGRFNLSNAIAAATAGLASGVDLDNVVAGLETARPVPGRLNAIECGQPFAVYIDYAHTPDAILRLCQSARELTRGGRLLLLFGCGGDRDRGKRPIMGEAATTAADYAVLTSDNPRSEDPMAILNEVKPGLRGNSWEIVPDRADAIRTIIGRAGDGDVVLLAGKGAEAYQEIKGERHPFSDSEQARAVLAVMGYTECEASERT